MMKGRRGPGRGDPTWIGSIGEVLTTKLLGMGRYEKFWNEWCVDQESLAGNGSCANFDVSLSQSHSCFSNVFDLLSFRFLNRHAIFR